MPSKYQKAVQKAVILFGENHTKVNKVKGGGRTIHIHHPTKNRALMYYPDAQYGLKNRKIMIFEILDTQKADKTIADITRSILVSNATQVQFIVKNDEIANKVGKIYDVIPSKFIDDFKIKKKKIAVSCQCYYAIIISKENAEDEEVPKSLLSGKVII